MAESRSKRHGWLPLFFVIGREVVVDGVGVGGGGGGGVRVQNERYLPGWRVLVFNPD